MAALKTPQVASALLLRRAPWDAIDAEFEKRIPFDQPAAHADALARMCMAGEAQCWHLHDASGARIGFVVTRVEEAHGRELVLLGVVSGSDLPLSPQIAGLVEDLARAEQCVSIRFHTIRSAAARYAAAIHGYRLTELVMRKDVTPANSQHAPAV